MHAQLPPFLAAAVCTPINIHKEYWSPVPVALNTARLEKQIDSQCGATNTKDKVHTHAPQGDKQVQDDLF
jgi:hypothetical protein